MLKYDLLTPYGEKLDKHSVLPEYPRPQFRRDSYVNLNGEWDYAIRKTDDLPDCYDGKIIVPFALESVLSGVCRQLKRKEVLVYHRTFDVPDGFLRDKTYLHLDAVDRECAVYLNGERVDHAWQYSGSCAGYLPITCDVSDAVLPCGNDLTVVVRDGTDYAYPHGKQSRKRGGIWYTPVSGIWQTVWLESLSAVGEISDLTVTPNLADNSVKVVVTTAAPTYTLTVSAEGTQLCCIETSDGSVDIPIKSPRLWSPEQPFLYDLTIKTSDDEIHSYFAMRSFAADGTTFLLNGKPYFVNGLLDQGYFSDGIYTPAAYEAFLDDIRYAKSLGFNALRKHIKVEPLMFYHYCDVEGILCLQDMVNTWKYSFIKDSVLPFSGLCKRLPYVTVPRDARQICSAHNLAILARLKNCPSVVYYTIFNEGWGQYDGDGEYERLKATDPTRVYDATSGWYKESLSDVESLHIYFKPIRLSPANRAIIVSEFGGYSCAVDGHRFNTSHNFGYRRYPSLPQLEEGFLQLFRQEILGNIANGIAGAIYTQVSDVEDETNGVLTYDRKIRKLNPDKVVPLMNEIFAAFAAAHAKN